MSTRALISVLLFLWLSFIISLNGQVNYVEKEKYPVIEEMRNQVEQEEALLDSITAAIIEKHEERIDRERKERVALRANLDNVDMPDAPADFETCWHFDPTPQYYTGTCWSFCTTSFLESELKRRYDKEIKLSELFTVYYEYVEKVKGYIRERGYSEFGQGSESNAVLRIMEKYGAVPREAYTGLKHYDRHNHKLMYQAIQNYLEYCDEKKYWDADVIMAKIKAILNRYMGAPPTTFLYKGKEMTPREFYQNVMQIDSQDYCEFMSTMAIPFYTRGKFDVPDNWWHDSSYYNIPLEEWYNLLSHALEKGYSVCIGGDVSEPGYIGAKDVAFVTESDIPLEYINQHSREFRFYNETTTDDHGVHIVGYTTKGWGNNKHDWYLIKDSARSGMHGEYEGYIFYRDDYVRLKMLTFMVHRDVAKDILTKF